MIFRRFSRKKWLTRPTEYTIIYSADSFENAVTKAPETVFYDKETMIGHVQNRRSTHEELYGQPGDNREKMVCR